MKDKFEDFKIRTFDLWDLYLHENQYPYLGRVYAWSRRLEAVGIRDMRSEERNELFDKVLPAWQKAMKIFTNPDGDNVLCLGNTERHLHWHFIPRYNEPRQFGGIEFVDPNPNGNYAPYSKKPLSKETLMSIKREIANNMPRIRVV